MAKRDPRVIECTAQRAPFARPILRHLRKVNHDAGPAIQQTIQWGMPGVLCRGEIVCGPGVPTIGAARSLP